MAYLNTSAQLAKEAADRANGVYRNTSAQQAKEAGARQAKLIADAAAKANVATSPQPTVTKPASMPKLIASYESSSIPEQPQSNIGASISNIFGRSQDKFATYNQGAGGQQEPFDIMAYINALNQAKQDQAIAALGRARDTQLTNLAGEEAGIKPMYYDKRNATAASNMMGRRSLAEELASRGETNSGVADQANINANMSLQSETGLLNRQESADIADIARRRTGVQNAYESDVANARAGLEAAAMQALIDQYNADRLFKLNEAGLTGTYNGGQTLAAKNQEFNQNLSSKQFDREGEQMKLDNLYRDKVFNYEKSRDAVADSQWQQAMNLDLRKQTFQETQAGIENALSQRRITRDEAEQALQWAKFNAEQDENSLDNQLKRAQIDGLNGKTNTNTTATVDDYASTINSLYVIRPSAANEYQSSIDTAGIKAYIDRLIAAGVDDAIIDSLAARYGIQ